MSDFSITREPRLLTVTNIDNAFIIEFMPAAPGDAVKVYLYGLMLVTSPSEDAADIETALGMTAEAVLDAYRFWEKQGLVRIIDSGKINVQYLDVRTSAKTVNVGTTGRHTELVARLQLILGTRNLCGAELQKIYDWIDIFGFEPDAAIEIVRHCIEIKGSRVNINYMDAVAKRLAAERYLSFEQVHECFIIDLESSIGAAKILKRWRISRRPTEDESELYRKWTRDWGFNDEAIDLACKDVVASDRPSFKYLDAILSGYQENGNISPEKMQQLSREQDMIAEITRRIYVNAGLANRSTTAAHRQQVELWYKDWCMDPELMFYAAELAAKAVHPFSETKKILAAWHQAGISTISAAKEFVDKQQSPRSEALRSESSRKKPNRALGYRQHQYTAEQLKELGIDLGEDVYK